MKNIILNALLAMSLIAPALAQTNNTNFIAGEKNIKYNTRQTSPIPKGIKDEYSLNINIANSVIFKGTITDLPQLIDGWINKSVVQARRLDYDLACDVVNPKNPTQTKNVGRLFGVVPITSDGAYHYEPGTLEMSVLPMGNAGGFTSKFGGIALGKPLARPANWLDTLKRETVNITRSVNGKTTTVVLKKYDKLEYRQHTLAAGPVAIYQSVTVNGEMLYDYDKYSWFFNNFTVQYPDNGVIKIDRISGTIRWVESPQRQTNGEGEYQFDVRVNEPPPNASTAFAPASDESAFFETDTTVPALVGTMKYKDTIRNNVTLASNVKIQLIGNNISKQQTVVLAKILILSAIVPMNSD